MWADRGVKKIFPEWNQFVDAIFFLRSNAFLIAHLDYLHVFSVHSNDLQPLLFQCASHRCATPVVNGSWLILDGITAVLMGLLRGLVEDLFKGFWESKYDAWM